jgi:Lhr-like helicase
MALVVVSWVSAGHRKAARKTQIVYVFPLKARSNDILRNLEAPLAGIREAP